MKSVARAFRSGERVPSGVPIHWWHFLWFLRPAGADAISDAIFAAIVWPEQYQ